MSIKITKAEYDALPDSLKAKFIADGDAYALQEEDVEGLKKSKAEILAEKKKAEAEIAELKKFKAEHEAKEADAAQKDLEAKGKYEEALANERKAWQERFEKLEAEKGTFLASLKRERLTNTLIENGALPDMAKYLVHELDGQTELEATDNGFRLKKHGGIGDDTEFKAFIGNVKESNPRFFESKAQAGGGASGSGTNAGSGKSMSEAQFDALHPKEQAAFITGGGSLV